MNIALTVNEKCKRVVQPLPPHQEYSPDNLGEFREFLKEKGKRESTIKTKYKIIKQIAKNINLWDSESVKRLIRNTKWIGKRKNLAGYAYKDWCELKGFDYELEKYPEEDQKLPYIPSETELDQLIAGFNLKYSSFLQLLKESAFRPFEAGSLTLNDIDIEKRIITLNAPAKRSNPRQFKMSNRLTTMLATLTSGIPRDKKIWTQRIDDLDRTFVRKRKIIAINIGNPNLIKITFKTFRHWKATMEYHKTKDILYVKELLGHKSIKNTLIYTHLVDFENEDEYIVKVASTIEEMVILLESGFEYVTDYQDKKILRKRK